MSWMECLVPNISFGIPVIKSIRGCTDKLFDVHLMIEEPIRYIEQFKEVGAEPSYYTCRSL